MDCRLSQMARSGQAPKVLQGLGASVNYADMMLLLRWVCAEENADLGMVYGYPAIKHGRPCTASLICQLQTWLRRWLISVFLIRRRSTQWSNRSQETSRRCSRILVVSISRLRFHFSSASYVLLQRCLSFPSCELSTKARSCGSCTALYWQDWLEA